MVLSPLESGGCKSLEVLLHDGHYFVHMRVIANRASEQHLQGGQRNVAGLLDAPDSRLLGCFAHGIHRGISIMPKQPLRSIEANASARRLSRKNTANYRP